MTVSVLVTVVGLLALAGVQYLMPGTFDNPAGANFDGVRHFARVLIPVTIPELSVPAFAWSFRILLAVCWLSYLMAILAGFSGPPLRARWLPPLVIALPIAYALLFPPSLSRDSYAYVAFGRMALEGDNPYLHTLRSFAERGDDAAAFHPVDAAATYGPLWTLLSSALVAVTRWSGLFGQVLGMKLLAAGAAILTAFAAREITRAYEPERADLTLLAVGLNPLLLIEGPGGAHNDCLMMALMLAGIALHTKRRPNAGYLLVALSVAVKFVSAAVVPWLVLEEARGRPVRRALATAAGAAAFVAAVGVVSFLPFWSGLSTFHGIRRVYEIQTAHPVAHGALLRLGATGLLYVGLTAWLWWTRVPGRFLAAWSLFALALPFLALPTWFAWYVLWALCVSLTRWDRTHLLISTACLALAVLHVALYAAPVVR